MKTTQIQIKRVSTEIHTTDKQHKRAYVENDLRTRALNLVKEVGYYGDGCWPVSDSILEIAEEYVAEKKERCVNMLNVETQEVWHLPFVTRFDYRYAKKQIKRITSLAPFDYCGFLTLTVDPHHFSSLNACYYSLSVAWHRLINAFRLDMKRGSKHIKNWSGFALKVVECQRSGNPHLHVLLEGCTFLDTSWVETLWKFGSEFKFERSNGRKRNINYLIKYMSKSVSWYGAKPQLSTAILWALRARTFSVCRPSGVMLSLEYSNKVTATKLKGRLVFLCVEELKYCNTWRVYADVMLRGVDYG